MIIIDVPAAWYFTSSHLIHDRTLATVPKCKNIGLRQIQYKIWAGSNQSLFKT